MSNRGEKFTDSKGRATSQVIVCLCPDELHRIEFRRIGRKVIDLQTWMLSQKGLNGLTPMNGRIIPDQDDRTTERAQQMLEKPDHFFASQTATVDLPAKFDLVSTRRNDQCADRVEALVMLQTGADEGRVPAGCPSAFERRDQIEATFVHENQARAEAAPLFLPVASGNAASGQSLRRRVGPPGAAAFGNSTACGAANARPHWDDSAPRTAAGSSGRCDPASSSRRHRRARERPGAIAELGASSSLGINDSDGREASSLVGVGAGWLRLATIGRRGARRQAFGQSRSALCLAATRPRRVCAAPPVVGQVLLVSCRQ